MGVVKIPLAFGKSELIIELPDTNPVNVLTMTDVPPLAAPEEYLRRQLEQPIASPPLADLCRGRSSACVVVCDITRPVPNPVLLRPLLETLEASGIPSEQITLLIATGLHRPSTPEEREVIVGRDILSRFRVVDHHARARDEQHSLGRTQRGTPVFIDRTYCDAELKITTGFIEPHLMAGFSGGRKLIAPGCAGEETIKALHSPAFLEHPGCREGSVDANPLHHELLEIAKKAGHDFIVNVALDQQHRIIGLYAGNPLRAHAEGIDFVRKAVRATLKDPADIVITTSAGYPLDLTYYQAIKGMTGALPAVRKGGVLVLAAECAEGLGSPEFTAMATAFPSAKAFTDRILSSPVVIDQWQLEECARAARHAKVILVSPRIAREHGGSLFVQAVPTMEEALRTAFAHVGANARIAVVPKGPYTLVELEAA
jgi:nickel-dependent lactate racemase